MIGSMLTGIMEKNHILHLKISRISNHIIQLFDDSEDVIFTGWLYKLNTTGFNKINSSEYGRGIDFKQIFVEYIGNTCYFPTSGNCFIKRINNVTGKDYKEDSLNLNWTKTIKCHDLC